MNVLIIPEDPGRDAFIIEPVIDRLFRDLGRPARIETLRDPHMRGTSDVFNRNLIREVIEDNRTTQLFLLVVDRDGDRTGNESKAATIKRDHPDKLIACLAVQEVEVWMLALYRGELGVPWPSVREHPDPKETYADPLLARKGWAARVGRGRKEAMRALPGQWAQLLGSCRELVNLKADIALWLQTKR